MARAKFFLWVARFWADFMAESENNRNFTDHLQNPMSILTACAIFGLNLHKRYRFSRQMMILGTACARNVQNSHKRCTTDAHLQSQTLAS